jgi:hypothetical protein
MRRNKNYKRLSDRALERVMRDVLKGMQAFSAGCAKPPGARSSGFHFATGNGLPRITSLRSSDLFEAEVEVDKTS